MGGAFWIKRFVVFLAGAFVIITIGQALQGHALSGSILHASIWAPLTAGVFVAARVIQSRKKQHCAICRDTPEMRWPRNDHT